MRARTAQRPPTGPGAPRRAHPAAGESCAVPPSAKDGCSAFPAGSTGEDGAWQGGAWPGGDGASGALGGAVPLRCGRRRRGAWGCRGYLAAPATGATPAAGAGATTGLLMLPAVPRCRGYRYCRDYRGCPCRRGYRY